MIAVRLMALWRGYIRLLCTDKEHIGGAERRLRALLLVLPYFAVAMTLNFRAIFGRPPLTVVDTSQDGIRLRCRVPDIIQMYVYLFGTWEPDLLAFMRRRLRPGDTFIDVGANVGYVSALAAKLVGRDGTVIAIEPAPFASAALQETAAMNDLSNVRLVTAAVSDREGELPLFVGLSHVSGLTTTVAPKFGLREQGRARSATLGALVSSEDLARTRLIKIDVEGAEDRVLAGILTSVDTLAPTAELTVELSPKWWADKELRPIDVLRPYLERGFNIFVLPNNNWPWRYLWPKAVDAPKRLRDLSVLERRISRLDIVLSRCDVEFL